MVANRRPAEIQAEVPTSVYALDLTRLSQLLSIPEDELVSGFQSHPTASDMHGVIVDAGEDVPFETVGHVAASSGEGNDHLLDDIARPHVNIKIRGDDDDEEVHGKKPLSPSSQERKIVRQVLLTAAVRKSGLDAHGNPKCLIQLGSQTIIAHILTQLYAAGIERVVIAIAAAGPQIVAVVKHTPFFSKMQIEFLDLGEDYSDGHARSILAARSLFPKGPFLIHTADHIFDKSIISKITNFQLNDAVACVLVETDIVGLTGLPPTAVRVQLGKENVTRIGRDLAQYDGFDAGLFVSSVAIFDALQDLAAKTRYFSLAEALNFFTKFNKLTYLPTAGETWFSIETQEQLAYTKDSDGLAVLSPWTVFLASTPQTLDDPLVTKNVVIGISAPDQEASLRVAGNTDASKIFEGFIIGVGNADQRGDNSGMTMSDYEAMMESDTRPLLALDRRKSTFLNSSRSRTSRHGSFIGGGGTTGLDDSFVLSFPMDDEASKTIENISASRHAYLIEMSGTMDPSTPASGGAQYMLAVPGKEYATPRPSRRTDLLPSDITDISLETRGYDDNLEVTVVVHRQVPLIGYLLLLSSLITVSSVGVALDMVDNVAPLLKLFWRNSASSLTTLPLAVYAIRTNGPPPLSRELVLTMLLAGASYAFYLGSYVVSLSLTSVGHATLFNNAHSLLLVFVKLCMGQPVALFEGLGAAVGIAGGAVTTMDATITGENNDNIVSATAFGDIVALVGAFGGATYFVMAKRLRPKMDLIVFMCSLTATSATVLLVTMLAMGEDLAFSTDVHNGLFGWLNPLPDRLLMLCYLVFVCDLVGTMGYISVMKYFDPIVISVVCLLEPIVATAMGIVVGVDAVPGFLTFVGAALVIGGTFMVIATQNQTTEQIDATEVIKSAANSATPKPLYSTRMKRRTLNYGSVH